MNKKVGRNDPCPCGSGKKYKQCCMLKQGEETAAKYTSAGKRKFKAKVIKLDKDLSAFTRAQYSNKLEDLKFPMTGQDFRVKKDEVQEEFKTEESGEPTPHTRRLPKEGESYQQATEDYRE